MTDIDNMELLGRIYKFTLSVARVLFVNRFVILLGFVLFYFCEGLLIKRVCVCRSYFYEVWNQRHVCQF